MKKKVRNLTASEIYDICHNSKCEKCPLEKICTTPRGLIELVQKDELNVVLNQEVEVEDDDCLERRE